MEQKTGVHYALYAYEGALRLIHSVLFHGMFTREVTSCSHRRRHRCRETQPFGSLLHQSSLLWGRHICGRTAWIAWRSVLCDPLRPPHPARRSGRSTVQVRTARSGRGPTCRPSCRSLRALDTGAGHKDAEYVIVVMGSGAVTCSETATYLQEKGEKVACQRARGGWS